MIEVAARTARLWAAAGGRSHSLGDLQPRSQLLLVAGPDTRKTGVLVLRTAYLVLERGVVMRGVEEEKGQTLRDERRQGP